MSIEHYVIYSKTLFLLMNNSSVNAKKIRLNKEFAEKFCNPLAISPVLKSYYNSTLQNIPI